MQHKQVTPEQLDIWLSDPVTKAYLECVNYCLEQAQKALADTGFIDPHNTSLTQYNAAVLKSRKETLIEMSDAFVLLGKYEKGVEA
jgi:hypothetical protein